MILLMINTAHYGLGLESEPVTTSFSNEYHARATETFSSTNMCSLFDKRLYFRDISWRCETYGSFMGFNKHDAATGTMKPKETSEARQNHT
jgi:hypothetical protein